MTETLNRSITLPTGLGIKIAWMETSALNEYLVLNDALCIPDFRMNLLSISDLKCRVTFDDESCVIHDPIRGLMIGHGEQISNLYVLSGASLAESSNKNFIFCECSCGHIYVAQ